MKVACNRQGEQEIALWGGLECTINRVADRYFSQIERSGHTGRIDDLERFASLGIGAIRYPVLWEHTAPGATESARWHWPDQRLARLRTLGLTPIVGLLHHGSGPAHTNLLDSAFAYGLARFAGDVARRYPWIDHYTPVNEPLTTARFSGLYGLWYPHASDDRSFILALLNQCRAIALSMDAIRQVNPRARLVQTEDLGKTYGTAEMARLAQFYNERRWLSWDLLCGLVKPGHALWDYLCAGGAAESELLWFADHPCPPDIIGINYYITGERWLDHRASRYPRRYGSCYGGTPHAEIETARALATPAPGLAPLLQEAWVRYRIPMAVTEAHIDSTREDQMRWLLEIWRAAGQSRQAGADLRAVTVWALLGSYDWNCLVTQCKGYYEPGPFDMRSPLPRETALAAMMRELSAGNEATHPVLAGSGWWRRPGRFFCPPVTSGETASALAPGPQAADAEPMQPVLIVGANGTLGQAFARIGDQRNLAFRLLSRQQMDMTRRDSIEAAIVRYRPWAIINAGGYVRVDDAETDRARCFRDNALGPALLAKACAEHGIGLLTFSSDLVFDGRQARPYIESDKVCPINLYGESKVAAERVVLAHDPAALVIRTSAFFGPWDRHNFVTRALGALAEGQPFIAAGDIAISPTYVPDLVHASLDLLVDHESGIWHITNGVALTWEELARKAARSAGVDAGPLEARCSEQMDYTAARPAYSALESERGVLLPPLDDAIARYLAARGASLTPMAAQSARAGGSR